MQELINFLSPNTNSILSSKRAGVFFNPRTYKKGNGLMVDATPSPNYEVSLRFSLDDQTSADKFSDEQFLWLRDMTLNVVGGQAILERKCTFFHLFQR